MRVFFQKVLDKVQKNVYNKNVETQDGRHNIKNLLDCEVRLHKIREPSAANRRLTFSFCYVELAVMNQR